jgi:hypothetical protein
MFPLDDEGYYSADLSSHYLDTWHVMEQLVDEGLTRSIGLSNFNRYIFFFYNNFYDKEYCIVLFALSQIRKFFGWIRSRVQFSNILIRIPSNIFFQYLFWCNLVRTVLWSRFDKTKRSESHRIHALNFTLFGQTKDFLSCN